MWYNQRKKRRFLFTKKTLSLILASFFALSLIPVSISAIDSEEIPRIHMEIMDETEELQEIHQDTLHVSQYQAGYFEYKEIISPQYEDGGTFSASDGLAAVK